MIPNTSLPRCFQLTEKGHARLAHDLPRLARYLSLYTTIIFESYGKGVQDQQIKQDLVNFALWTSEVVEQLLATMEAVSKAEYPDALWLSNYRRDQADHHEDKEKANLDKEQRVETVLVALMGSCCWSENTEPGEVIIKNLICPACDHPNAWTLASSPFFIKCTSETCGAHIRVLDLFPKLRVKLNIKEVEEGADS